MSMVQQAAAAKWRYTILSEVADALQAADSGVRSIEAVIAKTDLSVQEIADAFGSNDGLVIALAEMLAASMLEPLEGSTTAASFRPKLIAFGHRVTNEHSASQLKNLYRIALTEVIRNTGIGPDFYKHGPGLLRDELARFFEAARSAGIVGEEDSHYLASHLLALLKASFDLSDTFPSDGSKHSSHERGDVSQIIDLFCAGIHTGAENAHVVH
ncbi:MAG TPA: TetR/AcrR family transcriptional regulator C-terminal domain-containing protein [Variovorax sp.]|nr:TetR/AcrR family transcriptional regulator C-terminal domain-containing protein [Variovorax sp.]